MTSNSSLSQGSGWAPLSNVKRITMTVRGIVGGPQTLIAWWVERKVSRLIFPTQCIWRASSLVSGWRFRSLCLQTPWPPPRRGWMPFVYSANTWDYEFIFSSFRAREFRCHRRHGCQPEGHRVVTAETENTWGAVTGKHRLSFSKQRRGTSAWGRINRADTLLWPPASRAISICMTQDRLDALRLLSAQTF